jgi:DNA-binding MurR/RpiR family transcriptional regulator
MSLSVATRIRHHYATLTQAELSLADFILSFPGELSSYSASELAHMAGTSPAAVSRFVKRLGFANYEEMRRASRQSRAAGSPVYLMGRSDRQRTQLETCARETERLIHRTFAELDERHLQALIQALASAGTVWICGFRHSYYLAGYLQWQLKHLRRNVRLLPQAGETFGENLADIQHNDALLLLAMRRRAQVTDHLVTHTSAVGASVFVITDQSMPDLGAATGLLRCHTSSDAAVDDHSAVMALCHLLVRSLLEQLGSSGSSRLTDIDELHEVFEELR